MNRHPLESYSAYLDGHCLSDAEVLALRAWIAADERNAVEFIEFAVLHAAVTERLRLGRLLDDLASHRSAGGITPSLVAEAIREIETNSPRVIVPLPPAEPTPERGAWWHALAPAAAVAAVLLVAVFGLWQASEEAPLPRSAPEQPLAAAPVPASPRIAARLSTSFDAEWFEDQAVGVGQELLEGASLNLLSGVIKLEMLGGTAVVLEGPSQFTLTGPDRLRLLTGKAAARIEEEGHAFVLDTPSMQVIDLGTEFGVEAAASGDAQVMVFEGSVALGEPKGGASSDPAAASVAGDFVNRLTAGFQVNVDADQPLDAGIDPEVLTNPRHFLRPDEVDVRLRALAGSVADQKLAAHYERQRLAGLLAYQGFDAASGGSEFTLGIGGGGLHAQGQLKFVGDAQGNSGAIDVNGPVFMMLDTSRSGLFGRAGLLADSGRIGRPGTEVWLMWRMQRMHAAPEEAGSAGVSLMFGERNDVDEPVFFGRGYGESEALVMQTAWGLSPPPDGQRINVKLDGDLLQPEIQERLVDDGAHTWLTRVEFRDGPDAVSVWLDADLAELDTDRPHAYLEAAQIEFDRIRMAVNRTEGVWRFSEFAVATGPQALERLSHVAQFHVDE